MGESFKDYSCIQNFEDDFPPQESHPQNAELRRLISFSDLFLVCLRTIDHLILKLWIFSGYTASFTIEISKVQDFGNSELSPMILWQHDH